MTTNLVEYQHIRNGVKVTWQYLYSGGLVKATQTHSMNSDANYSNTHLYAILMTYTFNNILSSALHAQKYQYNISHKLLNYKVVILTNRLAILLLDNTRIRNNRRNSCLA
jgi:hypothetical protein